MKIERRQFTHYDSQVHQECDNKEYLEYEWVTTGVSTELCAFGFQIQEGTKYKWISLKDASEANWEEWLDKEEKIEVEELKKILERQEAQLKEAEEKYPQSKNPTLEINILNTTKSSIEGTKKLFDEERYFEASMSLGYQEGCFGHLNMLINPKYPMKEN